MTDKPHLIRKNPLIDLPEGVLPPPGAIPFTQNELGLWVPATDSNQHEKTAEEDNEPHAMFQFTVTTAGWREIFGQKLPLSEAIGRLQRYSLSEIVSLIGRITILLNLPTKQIGPIPEGLPQGPDFGKQFRLMERFVGEAPAREVFSRIYRSRGSEYDPERVVVFHERLSLNALKIALLTIDPDAPDRHEHPFAFVEALMILTDHIDPEQGEMNPDTDEGRSAIELYMAASSLFSESSHLIHDLSRAHYLYIEPHAELNALGAIDVPAMLKRATGLDAETTWIALYTLYASWQIRTLADLDAGRIGVHRTTYLSTISKLPPTESAQWFNLATWDIRDLQARVRQDYNLDELRSFDILPFEERPLVAFGEHVFCVSLPLLQRLAGSSIQHRFLNPVLFDKNDRNKFLETRGHLVERYTVELLKYGFQDRFIPERVLQEYAPGKSVCDGIISYPDAVILIECKTFSVGIDTRHATDYAKYRGRWKQSIERAANQLNSTIDLIENGSFSTLGLHTSNIRKIYPVVAVFEQPIQPLTYRKIISQDLLHHPLLHRRHSGNVAPLQFIRIKEIEQWAMAAEKGRSLVEILRGKTSSWESIELPFHHYIYLTGETFHHGHSGWHTERWEMLSNNIHRCLKERGLADRNEDMINNDLAS